MRESPALDIVEGLLARRRGSGHRPVALESGSELFETRVVLDRDCYRILEGVAFPDFERIPALLRHPVLFDGCNIWSRRLVEALGFTYYGIGV